MTADRIESVERGGSADVEAPPAVPASWPRWRSESRSVRRKPTLVLAERVRPADQG
jgi:hypothetical protein